MLLKEIIPIPRSIFLSAHNVLYNTSIYSCAKDEKFIERRSADRKKTITHSHLNQAFAEYNSFGTENSKLALPDKDLILCQLSLPAL